MRQRSILRRGIIAHGIGHNGPPPPIDPWPNASNTGPRVAPTIVQTGDYTTTSNGQVIPPLKITNGTIIIAHQNVTLLDYLVETTGTYGVFVQPGASGLISGYGKVIGPQTGIQGFGTFSAMNISQVENGHVIGNGSNVILEDSWVHNLASGDPDPHFDGVAAQGGSNNITLRRNRISGGGGQAIFLTSEFGAADNILIDANFLEDCTYNLVKGPGVTNVVFTNNLLKKGSSGFVNVSGEAITQTGNYSTRGQYIDGDNVPTVGAVAFSPSAGAASNDANINTAFRVACTLAAVGTEFRVIFQAGTAGTDLRGMAAGKRSSGVNSALPLQELLFGGQTLAAASIDLTSRTQLVSDWFTPPAGFIIGDAMIVGYSMENPGGTAYSAGNSNATSYFSGTVAGYADAAPAGFTAAANANFGILRIEAR